MRYLRWMVLAMVTGCAPSAAAPAGAGAPAADAAPRHDDEALTHFMLRSPGGRDTNVLVGDRSVTGPHVSITRYTDASDHSIRGDAFGRPVNLEVTADGAKGVYAGMPFDIHVKLSGDDLIIRGLVAGHPSELDFGPRGLKGNVGLCMYEMERKGMEFVGTRGCGVGGQVTSMSFPSSFGKWSLPEMAAVFAVLLSSVSG